MSDYKANVAPFINQIFYVTGMYGVQRPTHMHVGIDLATSKAENMYSILDGTVIHKKYSSVRGHYIVIKGDNGYAFLYQHMASASPLNVGDKVQIGQYVGTEGTTGQVTGLHLHMEMQNLSSGRDWYFGNDISYYINPAEYMGFPNKTGISVFYNGTPIPPTPPTPTPSSKNSLKWLKIKSRKIRINW